jgi:predicted nucleic acid-binding protein
MKVFIDHTGWYMLINSSADKHATAREYFQYLLDNRAQVFTNILEVNTAIDLIKRDCGLPLATEFSRTLDEASMLTHLHISWFTRRVRRNALKVFLSLKEPEVTLNHCLISEEVRKKKLNIIFSFDTRLKPFGIPLMPQ